LTFLLWAAVAAVVQMAVAAVVVAKFVKRLE
jgi:hypothetical protein